MSIQLGGVDLPDLVIDAEYAQVNVASVVEFSLGGTPLIWEDNRFGNELDLVGGEDFGWIDRDTMEQLLALSSVPNNTYTLDFEGDIKVVRFRNESPPAISADPIIPRPNHDGSDWYNNVRIKLMEV